MRRDSSRREVLVLAAGMAGWSRMYAFSSDFWNKKEPSEWSSEEIDQLTSKSPWAKEATASSNDTGQGQGGGMGRHGGGMGGGMGGGIGGGMGGGMGGSRRNGGGMTGQAFKGTVRWETAKPVIEALKTKQFPDAFKDHYVISVSGFPLTTNTSRRRQQQSDDDNSSSQSTEEMLDRLKGVTALQPKTKRDVQAGVVQQPPSAGYGTVWFGFSKEMLALKPEDKEVTFVTQFGHLNVKAKFVFKDMIYRGELAL